jgi:hypothetical protein
MPPDVPWTKPPQYRCFATTVDQNQPTDAGNATEESTTTLDIYTIAAIIMDEMDMFQPPILPATPAGPFRAIDILHETRSLIYKESLGVKLLVAEIDFENSLK